MKHWVMLGVFFLLVGFSLPASAQSIWYVYFYDPDHQSLILVDQYGIQQHYSLGLPETPYWMNPNEIAFAHTRQHVAFCYEGLIVRDLVAQVNLLEKDFGDASCHVGEFSDSDTQIGVGIMHVSVNADSVASMDKWEIVVLDTTTGTIAASLSSDDPATAVVIPYESATPPFYFIPDVRWLNGEEVLFIAQPIEGDGLAYRWNMVTGEVQPAHHWGGGFYDRYGAEEVWVAHLPEYPAALSAMPPLRNAVIYADRSGTEQVLYYTSEWIINRVRFLNDGQQVAIQVSSPLDLVNNPPLPGVSKWLVLDRQGNETELFVQEGQVNVTQAWEVFPATGGYSYLESTFDPNNGTGRSSLNLVRDGNDTQLWEMSVESSSPYRWELIYLSPMPVQELPPFPVFDMSEVPIGEG